MKQKLRNLIIKCLVVFTAVVLGQLILKWIGIPKKPEPLPEIKMTWDKDWWLSSNEVDDVFFHIKSITEIKPGIFEFETWGGREFIVNRGTTTYWIQYISSVPARNWVYKPKDPK